MRKILASMALILALIMTAMAAEEASPPRFRVAILPFKNLRNDPDTDSVGTVMADALTAKLAAVKTILVIEREQIAKAIEERHFQQSSLAKPETAKEVGRIVEADSVVIGSFAVAEERVCLSARVVDVRTGEAWNAATLAGADVADLSARLADAVLKSLSKKVAAYEAYGRGLEHEKKRRWKEAEAEFQRAVEVDPAFGLAWVRLGRMYQAQGVWQKALESYTKAEELFQANKDEKNVCWVLNNTGLVHCSRGRYEEAMECYQKSLEMSRRLGDEPGVAMTLNNMGEAHRSQGLYPEAMKRFEESLAISLKLGDEPTAAKTLRNIGGVYADQGRYADAVKGYEHSLALQRKLGDGPDMAGTLHTIGTLYDSQNHLEEALKCYEESLALSRKLGDEPTQASILHSMASLYKKRNERDKALPLAREAAQLARKLEFPNVGAYDKLVAELEKATR